MKRLMIAGALLAILLAAVVSVYASSAPDGLNKVAADQGLASQEQASPMSDSPFAGYSVGGQQSRLRGATAGVVGVAVTAAAAFGLFYLIKGRRA